MERISVTEAVRQFSNLLNRVFYQGATVELERGNKVIARITPVGPDSSIKVKNLNKLFGEFPSLGEDAKAFSEDLMQIRKQLPPEQNKWD
jgi:antitoxin (DNA-binding transcriptional repressor) of toxin-antitoxin stability system